MQLPSTVRKGLDLLASDGVGPLARKTAEHVRYHAQLVPKWAHGRWIGMTGNAVSLDGCTFDVSAANVDPVTKSDLAAGRYEGDERSFLDQLPPDRPLVELGACMGVVSCLSNRRLSDPSRHVVVEANPHMLPVIRENARRNNARFRVVHAAVAYEESGFVEFGIGRRVFDNRAGDDSGVETVRVRATTLGAILDAEGFRGSVSLVCDIEGAEVPMVDRERETFARVDWFMAEFHPGMTGQESVTTMQSTLQSVGLSLVERRGDTLLFRRGQA